MKQLPGLLLHHAPSTLCIFCCSVMSAGPMLCCYRFALFAGQVKSKVHKAVAAVMKRKNNFEASFSTVRRTPVTLWDLTLTLLCPTLFF